MKKKSHNASNSKIQLFVLIAIVAIISGIAGGLVVIQQQNIENQLAGKHAEVGEEHNTYDPNYQPVYDPEFF